MGSHVLVVLSLLLVVLLGAGFDVAEALNKHAQRHVNPNHNHDHALLAHHNHGKFECENHWSTAHATFYGGADGSDTRGNFIYLLISTSMLHDKNECLVFFFALKHELL